MNDGNNVGSEYIKLTPLGHTWIFDIDGTIVVHNGYLQNDCDILLPGVREFFLSIPPEDRVIFLTSRKKEYREITESFLAKNNIRFDQIIYDMPFGERILVNDKKPSGLSMAIAVNTERNTFMEQRFEIDSSL